MRGRGCRAGAGGRNCRARQEEPPEPAYSSHSFTAAPPPAPAPQTQHEGFPASLQFSEPATRGQCGPCGCGQGRLRPPRSHAFLSGIPAHQDASPLDDALGLQPSGGVLRASSMESRSRPGNPPAAEPKSTHGAGSVLLMTHWAPPAPAH